MLIFWLNPPIAPVIVEATLTAIIKLNLNDVIKINGAIFCQVNKIIHCCQFKKFETWGNQKWKGESPAFITKDAKVIVSVNSKFKFSSKLKNKTTLKIIITEAIA